jgi:hypothetical protein
MVVPYKLVLANVKQEDDNVLITRAFLNFLLCQILQHVEFDEDSYLETNADVAASVRQGIWASGKAHFVARGYFEGRDGATKGVSEPWYLRNNPDVAGAVRSGEWASGESHFMETGMFEWRAPNKEVQDVYAAWKDVLHPRPSSAMNSPDLEISPASSLMD